MNQALYAHMNNKRKMKKKTIGQQWFSKTWFRAKQLGTKEYIFYDSIQVKTENYCELSQVPRALFHVWMLTRMKNNDF
jgi:hypothetical protein